ncbi:MAG: ParB N-terminal domain-containing protein [Acidimicrobiia bacterium]|nr:ParB N-terminal domain-containing protein [Acidimicrobiia bacterium]
MADPTNIAPALKAFERDIGDFIELDANPRRGDLDAIAKSLAKFGQRYPIVERDGVIIAGNHRLQAARDLGWQRIAVVGADDLTEEEAYAFAATDNRTGDLGDYDEGLLAAFLQRVDTDLLDFTGYTATDLDDILFVAGIGTEDGPGVGLGVSMRDAAEGWNEAGTRTFVLTFPLDEYRALDEALVGLRTQLGLDTNSLVFAHLVAEAAAEYE